MRIIICIIWAFIFQPHAGGQTADRRAIVSYNEGMDKFFRKDYRDAISAFSWAIRIDSGFLQAYENRGVSKYYLKDFRGAIDDFDKALKINPNDYNTLGRRGWAKFHIQDFSGAIDDFTIAIGGTLNNAQYYNGMGQAKYNLGHYNEAVADFTKVIRQWTSDRVHRRTAFFWRGLAKTRSGQIESACRDFQKASAMGYAMADELSDIYCK